jgi:hypothetical protein
MTKKPEGIRIDGKKLQELREKEGKTLHRYFPSLGNNSHLMFSHT